MPKKPERIDTERLQSMLYHAHNKCQAEDCVHRLEIRNELCLMHQKKLASCLLAEPWEG